MVRETTKCVPVISKTPFGWEARRLQVHKNKSSCHNSSLRAQDDRSPSLTLWHLRESEPFTHSLSRPHLYCSMENPAFGGGAKCSQSPEFVVKQTFKSSLLEVQMGYCGKHQSLPAIVMFANNVAPAAGHMAKQRRLITFHYCSKIVKHSRAFALVAQPDNELIAARCERAAEDHTTSRLT